MTKSVAFKVSALTAAAILSTAAHASPNLSGGVWFNYQYAQNDKAQQESWGVIDSEALILYADGDVPDTPGLTLQRPALVRAVLQTQTTTAPVASLEFTKPGLVTSLKMAL